MDISLNLSKSLRHRSLFSASLRSSYSICLFVPRNKKNKPNFSIDVGSRNRLDFIFLRRSLINFQKLNRTRSASVGALCNSYILSSSPRSVGILFKSTHLTKMHRYRSVCARHHQLQIHTTTVFIRVILGMTFYLLGNKWMDRVLESARAGKCHSLYSWGFPRRHQQRNRV